MQSINDVFKLVKLEPFCDQFTNLKARGGLYHRINGKSTRGDKPKELTDNDKAELKAGLTKMVQEINTIIETL